MSAAARAFESRRFSTLSNNYRLVVAWRTPRRGGNKRADWWTARATPGARNSTLFLWSHTRGLFHCCSVAPFSVGERLIKCRQCTASIGWGWLEMIVLFRFSAWVGIGEVRSRQVWRLSSQDFGNKFLIFKLNFMDIFLSIFFFLIINSYFLNI